MNNIERPARLLAMLCHLSSNIWLPISLIASSIFHILVYIPFINILLPFYIWKRYKNIYPWVKTNGKESLNFQISITTYIIFYIICVLLIAPTCGMDLSKIPPANTLERRGFDYFLGMAFFPMAVILFYQIVCSLSAAIQAYRGKIYIYSSTIRFLK